MNRWARWAIWSLIVLGAGAGVYFGFRSPAVPVDVGEVQQGTLRVSVDDYGKTRVRERYVVSAPVTGQMLRVELHAGDRVEANKTVLAVIQPTVPTLLDARAVAQAEARIQAAEESVNLSTARVGHAKEEQELAKHAFERARDLLARKSISQSEFDTAEHMFQVAEAERRAAEFAFKVASYELEIAKAALMRSQTNGSERSGNSRMEIRSPVTGSVFRVRRESAGVVEMGAPLMEIGDNTDLEVELEVLSEDAARIQPGNRVILEQWGGEPIDARVRTVEPSGFLKISALGVEEQRVYVIADVVTPQEQRSELGDGFRVEARIVIWEGEVLKVPASALFREKGEWNVFVLERRRAKQRRVEVGKSNGLQTEVLAGLTNGERVILNPSDRVEDGVRVAGR